LEVEGGSWTYGGYAYPAWEEESWVAETACEGEDAGGDVGVAGVDGEEANHCCLWGVVDQPMVVSCDRGLIFMGWPYHLDIKQSVKKNDRYPEAKHYPVVSSQLPSKAYPKPSLPI
jgi:hypothetical protein